MAKYFNKQILTLLVIFSALASFSSIHTNYSKSENIENKIINAHPGPELKRVLIVEFSTTMNGCNYQVTIVFETTTGNGAGWIKRTCPGFSPQTIYFTVSGAVVARGANADNLCDFRYKDGTPASLSSEEKQLIVDGMNDYEEWVEGE